MIAMHSCVFAKNAVLKCHQMTRFSTSVIHPNLSIFSAVMTDAIGNTVQKMGTRYKMTLEELMNRWQAFAMEQRDDYMNMPISHANLEKLRVILESEYMRRNPHSLPATTPKHPQAKKLNTNWSLFLFSQLCRIVLSAVDRQGTPTSPVSPFPLTPQTAQTPSKPNSAPVPAG